MCVTEVDRVTRSGVMKVMDQTGHTEVSWNADNAAEVEVARTAFDELTKKGYQAFKVTDRGGQGERMRSFDASAEKILMVPQLKGG